MDEKNLIQDEHNGTRLTALLEAFANKASYKTRLHLYQRVFPFPGDCFSPFDPALPFLFHKDFPGDVYKWQQTEKRLSGGLRQTVFANEACIVLDITPRNSQRRIFNEFVIDQFESADGRFAAMMGALQTGAVFEGKSVAERYAESNSLLSRIDYAMNDRKSIRLEGQMTRVFFLGYTDGMEGIKKQFPYKRKFIELYLYAQGQMFAQYRRLLSRKIAYEAIAQTAPDQYPEGTPDWKAQLQLLQRTGVVDMLESRFAQSEAGNRNLLDTTLCFIIGQHEKMSAAVRSYLDSIRFQRR